MASILVINTGGTISMVDAGDGSLGSSNIHYSDDTDTAITNANNSSEILADLLAQVSDGLAVNFMYTTLVDHTGQVLPPCDSANINEQHWLAIIKLIEQIPSADAVLILHGTDTMAYTASALAIAMPLLNKPVVLTGAQMPISQLASDGMQNLRLSLEVLSQPSLYPQEVMIAFGGLLLRGCRARKASTQSALGFDTPHEPVIAELFPNIRRVSHMQLLRVLPEGINTHVNFSNHVLYLNLQPSIRPDFIKSLIVNTDIEGLVIRVFGSGTAPETLNLAKLVEQARELTQGRFQCVVIVSGVYKGGLDLARYAAAKTLQSPYIFNGRDMTPEAAMTKLMWALAPERKAMLATIMKHSFVGEMDEKEGT